MDVVALLDALAAVGLSGAVEDAVADAAGDATEVPLSAVKGLLTGAGLGAAAAVRIVRQLVSVSRIVVFVVAFFAYLKAVSGPHPQPPHTRFTDGGHAGGDRRCCDPGPRAGGT